MQCLYLSYIRTITIIIIISYHLVAILVASGYVYATSTGLPPEGNHIASWLLWYSLATINVQAITIS